MVREKEKNSYNFTLLLMEFERHTEDPITSLGIGLKAALSEIGIVLNPKTGVFEKSPRGQIYAKSWSPEELRKIADYMEVYPECQQIEGKDPWENSFVAKLDHWNKLRQEAITKIEEKDGL